MSSKKVRRIGSVIVTVKITVETPIKEGTFLNKYDEVMKDTKVKNTPANKA
ncbi:TPA: hypothetical protein HA219_03205 [Candidatus Woesearchaeota archaeon]|nr:hypothetical protein [Candidatus Woesearchaeota archaeon]